MIHPRNTSDPVSRLHFWLADSRAKGGLEFPGLRIEHFARDYQSISPALASHFSCFDDHVEEDWLCMDDAATEIVRHDGSVLRVLGFLEGEEVSPQRFFVELFSRGRLIVERHLGSSISWAGENSFRVALAPAGTFQPPGFHLAVDPLKFTPTCLISIIGDTYLEWLHNREPNSSGLPAAS